MSDPDGTSRMQGAMAGSDGSWVMTMGGLGLFLEPGGRPLGRREISTVPASSLVVVVVVLGFLEGGVGVVVGAEEVAAVSESSECGGK